MEVKVHIFFLGGPLCGFSGEFPTKWPSGNEWASVACCRDATCEACKRELERLKNLEKEPQPPKAEVATGPAKQAG